MCTLLSKQTISRNIIIAMLKLALSTEQSAIKGVDIFVHFDIINAVLSIVKVMSSPIKLEVALKVINCHFIIYGTHCYHSGKSRGILV